jgi:hypothetical protein
MASETKDAGAPAPGVRTYQGRCHCGAVRFEVDADLGAPLSRCNCSICTKVQSAVAVVRPSALRLVSGEDRLTHYRQREGGNQFAFCSRCGVHLFAHGDIPELGGEVRGVNVNSLEGVELARLRYQYWDGRHDNWAAGSRGEPWPIGA